MAEREAEKSAHCLFHSYETQEDLAKSIFPWKMDVLLFSGFLIAFLNKQTAEKRIKKEKQRKPLQHGFGFSARNLLNSSKLSFLILASGETDELNDLLFTIRIFILFYFIFLLLSEEKKLKYIEQRRAKKGKPKEMLSQMIFPEISEQLCHEKKDYSLSQWPNTT